MRRGHRPAAAVVASPGRDPMTTERVLPAVALPAPARPATAVRRPRVVASARVARRNEAWLTTPARAGMLIGASAAVYAVTLAGVSGLQSQSDAELVARRQPWMDQLAETRAANDRLEATIV